MRPQAVNTRPKGYHLTPEQAAAQKKRRDAWRTAHDKDVLRRAPATEQQSIQALAIRAGLRVVNGKVG